ncbi:thiol-disulfide oxidoreductase ResA [Lentibacillus cibarius]|uniref:Thiol-disulfide oxidoreductase ResA n=1 Tax=Lentibacillus cibarius TaxID=2583219 RepID=A0A549YJR6_9BACI|nr:thiol-disulfide oxidoreductase ResA [Lentibacillus cibarius]TRM12136.1 thiol-disulfide oxidoreductase ResA [Lentibacillus cibarius]
MNLEQIKKNKKNKKRNRLILRTVILAVLVGAVVFALYNNFQGDNTTYEEGDKAPDFKLKQINKNNELETVQLSELKGKGVMLNFWGTWCKPCEDEMPYMQKLYPEYKQKGIEIVAVSLDNTETVVDRFIDKYDLTFPIPHDTTEEVRDLYDIGPIPSTVFINPDGVIEERVLGALTLDKLEGYLQDIQPEQ